MAQAPKTQRLIDAAKAYKRLVCDQSDEVDPQGEQDWFSMSLGFFMGYGLTLDEAHSLSLWVAYETGDFKALGYENWG
jgi:hypothetical protein